MIKIDKTNLTFHMSTQKVSYIVAVNKETKQIETVHFGKKLNNRKNQNDIKKHFERPFSTWLEDKKDFSLDTMQLEFSTLGFSDFRHPTLDVEVHDSSLSHFKYVSHKTETYNGVSESGLPFAHSGNKTLVIIIRDEVKEIDVELRYTPFDKENVIVKNMKVINNSSTDVRINKAMSSSLDLPSSKYNLTTLDGSWIRERNISEHEIESNHFRIASREGITSATHHPFLGLTEEHTTESKGIAFGFTLMYSSNFEINYEVNQYKNARVSMGINSDTFKWNLAKGESFETPQAVMTFSDEGKNGMSQNFHNFVKNNISPKAWSKKERPVLLNNWEATYFDFNEDKIVELAKAGKEVGVELFCLDDGWFGKRNAADSSLGDWFADKAKLPNGVPGLAKKITDLDMKFGIWIEPEMISEKSDLFKAHPDWAVNDANYPIVRGRDQLVLDMTNPDVIKYLTDTFTKLISSADISYVKWDMNRPFAHSPYKGFEHKYILGFYKLLRTLTETFPEVLFEGCAAGGSRFDMAALRYFPQIWTSDDTDAYERVKIQYGTSMLYPLNVMSNHVSAVPNHQIKRTTDLKTRQDVANFGVLGYELNLLETSDEDKKAIAEHIGTYKSLRKQIMNGDFYRLQSPYKNDVSGWQVVSASKKFAVGLMFKSLAMPNPLVETIKLDGLEDDYIYSIPTTDFIFAGDELKSEGIFLPPDMAFGDFKSTLFVLNSKGGFSTAKPAKLLSDAKALMRTKRGK